MSESSAERGEHEIVGSIEELVISMATNVDLALYRAEAVRLARSLRAGRGHPDGEDKGTEQIADRFAGG